MDKSSLRKWTTAAFFSFGLGGVALLWLLISSSPNHAGRLGLPVFLANGLTGGFLWWYLLRRNFEFSVWRGVVIGLVIGLIALPVFWMIAATLYYFLGKEIPVLGQVITPLEALLLLPRVTILAWASLGWASVAMCAFVSGLLAYIKVRTLREPPATTIFLRVFHVLGVVLLIVGSFVLVIGFVPVSTRGLESQSNPVNAYDLAITQLEQIQADDLAHNIVEECKTQWFTHGQKTEKVIVFFHGLSNCPEQFVPLAQEFFDQGYNVIIPRFPGHVDSSRDPIYMTPTAEEYRPMADESIDLAHGLGDHVYVLGLSAGGGVAAWVAQYRSDVERVVVVAPFFGAIGLPSGLDRWGTNLITRLPNIPFPFSTSVPYQYLGMSSLGIGETMRFAEVPEKASLTEPIRAGSVILVTNENDNTISNPFARRVLEQWKAHGANAEEFVIDKKYGLPHDVIDIHQNGSDPELIYPLMIDLVEGRTPVMP